MGGAKVVVISRGLKVIGIDLERLAVALREAPGFVRDLLRFRSIKDQPLPFGRVHPCLFDRNQEAGTASGHYFHQDLYVAWRIFEHRPERHVDVGSRIDGFVAHLLVFREVEVVDIRPLTSKVPGLVFHQGDARTMSPFNDGELPSVSCLHAAEHIGLGRYGDELDPRGHEKLIRSLVRVTAPGGRIYFSVPVSGQERVEFNAHRVFKPETISGLFEGCVLQEFALVDDAGDLVTDATFDLARRQRLGCGIFTFQRV